MGYGRLQAADEILEECDGFLNEDQQHVYEEALRDERLHPLRGNIVSLRECVLDDTPLTLGNLLEDLVRFRSPLSDFDDAAEYCDSPWRLSTRLRDLT